MVEKSKQVAVDKTQKNFKKQAHKNINNVLSQIANDTRLNNIFQCTFPEFIFRNHMPHKNEAILGKSMSDETLGTYLNFY